MAVFLTIVAMVAIATSISFATIIVVGLVQKRVAKTQPERFSFTK